jgi:hypothetical protein
MTTPVHGGTPTTAAFFVQAVVSFAVSTGAVVLGVAFLPVDPWIRAFLAVGTLFTVSSAFTLAKCVRDRQDESSVAGRVDRARVDKLLTEHDPFKTVG